MDVEDGGAARCAASSCATRASSTAWSRGSSQFGSEVTRVAHEVGGEGKLGAQARVHGVSGVWKDLTDSVNLMASNLTSQVREIARVTTAVAQGDLTKTITIDVKGEILELKNTINTMVEQLRAFANEVTRVAREVGTEGRLGGQATVRGVSRRVARADRVGQLDGEQPDVPGAQHRRGDERGRRRRPRQEDHRRGEGRDPRRSRTRSTSWSISCRAFAAEVTRVAREVGTEGVLGGQAEVADVSRRVARADAERQLDGVEPDVAGAQHRRGRHRDRRRRPVEEDRASTRAARSSRSRTRSTRPSTSSAGSPPRSRASRASSARKARSASPRTSRTSAASGRS